MPLGLKGKEHPIESRHGGIRAVQQAEEIKAYQSKTSVIDAKGTEA